ncbi:hypothetical protein E6Q11_03815 [Candidatus Dojkabacteria bacterium]|uniref:Uncharacterized protein n=1 Tax=Candidatus Dojkabacteria bacterium TaxID=2099670 RepID=A0A5C7J644_9BACT|nr:MAG: hypothetical protein E6Q11_03815 [Candidatus Dojkabacteria bacterium]
MSEQKTIVYVDYQGNELPNHDGTLILIDEKTGIQYFDIDGKGFLHDGSPLSMQNGKMQFFLHDGKAIIHDGSPIKLANGQTQFFNENGYAMWPVDVERMNRLHSEQLDVFFQKMVQRINKENPLTEAETEDLRLIFLAAERPDSEESRNMAWCEDIHATGIKPISDETSHYLNTLEVIWLRVWTKYKLRHKETLAARFVLNWQKKEGCILAVLRSAESMLTDELELELKKAETAINPPITYNELLKCSLTNDGVFELDDRLHRYVKKMRKGEGTERFIGFFKEAYKSKSVALEDRIKCWQEPLYLYRCLAEIVWFNSVREKADGVYHKPAALPIIISDTINEIVKKGTWMDPETYQIMSKDGKELAVVDRDNLNHIPSIPMATLQKILSPHNAKILNSVNYLRLVTWEVVTATQQIISNKSDARAIRVLGGYPEIAKLCGAGTGGYARDQIKKILAWQASPQSYILHDRYGNEKIVAEGNMIAFERFHGGNVDSTVTIVLGTMLLPHSVFKLLRSKKLSSEATMLFPLPTYEPNLIGKPNTFASQISFQWDFLAEMRKKAKELVANGCVHMPREKLIELAKRSNLGSPFHLKVIDAWLNDGEKPAFLSLVEKDHYALAPESRQLQDFIIEGGKREMALSKAGKLSAKRRSQGRFNNLSARSKGSERPV